MARWLGIDVGGTKVALALGDDEGRILARRRRPTDPSGDPERDVAALVEDARALRAEAGDAGGAIEAVGLSLPGPIDREQGRVEPPNLPGWKDVPIAARVAEGLGLPVRLENDANAAALAEWQHGAGRGSRDCIYLTMSTGVGGGIIADGALLRGQGGNAGEVGHAPIVWEGRLCGCGQRGCLEAYVGGRAWAGHLREVTPDESRVLALAGGREAITAEHLVSAAHEGDAFACAELARWVEHLAQGVVALAFTLAPQVVVLGTIAIAAGEALCFEPLRRSVEAHLWPRYARGLEIRPAALGEALPYYAGLCAARYGAPSPS